MTCSPRRGRSCGHPPRPRQGSRPAAACSSSTWSRSWVTAARRGQGRRAGLCPASQGGIDPAPAALGQHALYKERGTAVRQAGVNGQEDGAAGFTAAAPAPARAAPAQVGAAPALAFSLCRVAETSRELICGSAVWASAAGTASRTESPRGRALPPRGPRARRPARPAHGAPGIGVGQRAHRPTCSQCPKGRQIRARAAGTTCQPGQHQHHQHGDEGPGVAAVAPALVGPLQQQGLRMVRKLCSSRLMAPSLPARRAAWRWRARRRCREAQPPPRQRSRRGRPGPALRARRGAAGGTRAVSCASWSDRRLPHAGCSRTRSCTASLAPPSPALCAGAQPLLCGQRGLQALQLVYQAPLVGLRVVGRPGWAAARITARSALARSPCSVVSAVSRRCSWSTRRRLLACVLLAACWAAARMSARSPWAWSSWRRSSSQLPAAASRSRPSSWLPPRAAPRPGGRRPRGAHGQGT